MLTYDLFEKNKYYALYSGIRGDILSGNLKHGEKLPSKRALAEHLGVSVITVQTAYEQLLAEGYIQSEERRGYFVSDVNFAVAPAISRNEPHFLRSDGVGKEENAGVAIDLVSGRAPVKLFPFSTWAKLMRQTLSEEGGHLLERVPCGGDPSLKRAIAGYLQRFRGFKVDPEHIVIGAGAEYLYGVIVQLLGRNKPYAVENPVYPRVPHTYALNGAKCVSVPVTEAGADVAAAEKTNACALHISPSHQYPTGAVMPAANRSKLLAWVEKTGAYIIEDDYDSEFRLFGKPLQTMAGMNGERVIYINTFSKTLAPSLRMGYMVLPPRLYARYCEIFGSSANVVPLFEQKTLAKMLDGGYFERHVNRLRNYYRGVRAVLLEKIAALPVEKEIIETGGGLHLTVRLPEFASDAEIKRAAEEHGIKIKCVSDYLSAPDPRYDKVAVINYSSVEEEQLKRLNPHLVDAFPQIIP
ncbi:MAG: PLP-dependent aminotransferase family protein [Clostridia bacterium]|nr:PLP-dependent aminotransferase family protein [Clostridia bacterium]